MDIMEDFILNLINEQCKKRRERHGTLESGIIMAIVKYELYPNEEKEGLFWEVSDVLKKLVREKKIVNIKGNYYPASNNSLVRI